MSPAARQGLALHLFLALPYAGAGLVAPYAAALTLQAAWLVMLLVLLAVRRSDGALLVPFAAAALLPLSVAVGETVLGWD